MLGPILKALGVKITDDDLRKIETLIPQIPTKAAEIVNVISAALQAADRRIAALEAQQAELIQLLKGEYGRTNHHDGSNPGSVINGANRNGN